MERWRVLVVDDEPGMCRGVQRVLQRRTVQLPDLGAEIAFETEGVETLSEARSAVAARRPDVILLDYKLPDGSGLDFLRELRASQWDGLVIIITAFASLDVAVAATRNGAFDFLAKPFAPEELETVVSKAVRTLVVERRARRLEEERRRTRLEFLSVLAHELKAPIGVVEGILRLMASRVLGTDISAYDRHIQRALARLEGMRKLILDLLDLTRIEAGERRREIGRVDVVEIARAALDMVASDAAARKIQLCLHAQSPVELWADRSELEIILNNLVSNAVKYNRDEGSVDVRLRRLEDGVEIEVADTGVGMTEEEQARLFREFSRIRNEKTRNIPGSGLGLSTVKKLVQLYHGEITVRSQPDVGSTFTVRLRDAMVSNPSNPPQAQVISPIPAGEPR